MSETCSVSKETMSTATLKSTSAVDAFKTMKKGKALSNDQIHSTLTETKDAIDQRRRQAPLSARGEAIAEDASSIIENTKRFLEEKNPDGLWQQFFYHSKAVREHAKENTEQVKMFTTDLSDRVSDIYYIARRVAIEIIKSKQFRHLLQDIITLSQRILWKMNQDGNENLHMNEEERVILVAKLYAILTVIADNQGFHRAINGILSLLDQLRKGANPLKAVAPSQECKDFSKDIVSMLERFTGEGSIDPLFNSLRKFYDLITQDPNALEAFRETRQYIIECLQHPSHMHSHLQKQKFENIFDKMRVLMDNPKYKQYSHDVFDEANILLSRFKEDQSLQALNDSCRRLINDVMLDVNGKPSLWALRESSHQLKNIFLPVIMSQMACIPAGRISGTIKKYDYVLDNVVFAAYDVVPEFVNIDTISELWVDPKGSENDKMRSFLSLEMTNIKSHLRNINFYYKKRTFPKITDEGVADIDIAGEGIKVFIEWKINTSVGEPMRFSLFRVNCSIDQLSVRIKDGHHRLLDKLVVKIFNRRVKSSLEDEVETALSYFGRTVAEYLNDAVNSVLHQGKGKDGPINLVNPK